jgi:hypothetical protein
MFGFSDQDLTVFFVFGGLVAQQAQKGCREAQSP